MMTTVFEVKLIDGRIFRVFCGNSNQIQRFRNSIQKIQHYKPYVREITNGIHTVTQWDKIIETLTQ